MKHGLGRLVGEPPGTSLGQGPPRLDISPALACALALALAPTTLACRPPVQQPAAQWPAAEWPVSTPEAEGLDPAAVDSLLADIDAGRYGLIDHFLLVRHGRVVADRRWDHAARYAELLAAQDDTAAHQYNYDHPAWHPFYRDTRLHTLQSVTKSVLSVAFGIAVDEGHLPGVESPAWPYLRAYQPDTSDPRRTAATLEDFLTMRSGIEWAAPGQTYPPGSAPH